MGSYLQLGHDSWNLLEEPYAGPFAGAILSPVNHTPSEAIERLKRLGARRDSLEIVLDPQLYNPSSQRGKLTSWEYYSSEFETRDASDPEWWSARSGAIAAEALTIGANAICSPALIPRAWSNDYYRFTIDVGDATKSVAQMLGLDTLLTAIVPLDTLDAKRTLEISSILSGSSCDRIYLCFLADGITQREPLRDASALASAVHLVRLLATTHRIHVGCAAQDVVLWKAAGATDASSGKFLNVRRFSPSRWQEEEGEGRQVPYWNDDRLIALIRDSEVLRLNRDGWFTGRSFDENPASREILELLIRNKGEPWQKLSWLQYLRWFSNMDGQIQDLATGERMLVAADDAWGIVLQRKMLFVDRFNDGSHIRSWLNALREGASR